MKLYVYDLLQNTNGEEGDEAWGLGVRCVEFHQPILSFVCVLRILYNKTVLKYSI